MFAGDDFCGEIDRARSNHGSWLEKKCEKIAKWAICQLRHMRPQLCDRPVGRRRFNGGRFLAGRSWNSGNERFLLLAKR